MKSLKARHNPLAHSHQQLEVLAHGTTCDYALIPFQQKLEQAGLYPLKPTQVETFQINLGKMCNQVCSHCHVDAGPDRKEIMTRETMEQCLVVLESHPQIHTVDLTGGAPEMNPHFRWFVQELGKLNKKTIVRCNLTIILANKRFYDLPQFYKDHQVEVISSLPCYTQDNTDEQRGKGVFDSSIRALQMLNAAGYGQTGSGLSLNLVYNPAGAFLPPSQAALERDYKQELRQRYGIEFNQLFVITNMPISRYLDYLLTAGKYEHYMELLVNAYNSAAAQKVMCRNSISIGWDGYLYDCDFNQMLELKVSSRHQHISDFSAGEMDGRDIIIGQHCYGCTAGAGSSCGGAVA